MEVPDEIPFNSLEHCSYRYLQQLAKSMNLPSNVKKVYLIEMISAKKYNSAEQLESIVTRIKNERKQTAKPRKPNTRKKKRVQGTEISSTINHSPPICSTPTTLPTPYPSTRIIKKYNSILNPLIAKKTIESDRVLRSYNNRLRRSTKYSIMNINDTTVMGVVESRNRVSQKVQERQYEWNMDLQEYRPMRVADCVVQRQRSLNTDYVLPQPRPFYVDVNQIQREEFDSGERQVVPVVRSSSASAVRERRLSGIYPLEAKHSYYQPLPGVGFRRQDGRISKINAVVQKHRNPESMIKNKMTQTTVQRRLIQKPVVVSLRNALRPKLKTVQNVVNYKIDGHFSNSSTESARESSTDREIPRMITGESFQESFDDTTIGERRMLVKSRDYSIATAIQAAKIANAKKTFAGNIYASGNETRRTGNKTYLTENQAWHTDKTYAIETQSRHADNKMYVAQNQTWCTNNIKYATENQTRRPGNKPNIIQNQMKHARNKMRATENPTRYIEDKTPYATENQSRRTCNETYAIENQTKRTYNKTYVNVEATENPTRRIDNKDFATENQAKNIEARVYVVDNANRPISLANQNCATNVERQPHIKTYTKNSNRSTGNKKYTVNKIENSDYVLVVSKEQAANKINETLNPNNIIESLIYSNQSDNAVDLNQNSVAKVTTENIDRIETDYPNMSALTDVNPGDQAEVISEAVTEPSGSSSVYYHKKIRAEQVRTQRLSSSLEMAAPMENTLPHISEVFSQFNEPRYKQYTQPLYVDCGDDARTVNGTGGSGLLETIYNYFAPDLEQPLNFHHMIGTTATKCVYSTHTTTTAVARMPSTGLANYDNTSMRDSQQYNIETESMPKQEYVRSSEQQDDVTCDEVLPQSPVSPATSLPSEPGPGAARSDLDNIEDALELISQDGDYMERIGMDVRMQCFLCDWAGPKSILEYHVRLEHPSAIVPRAAAAWSCGVRARALQLSARAGRLLLLRAARGPAAFWAQLAVLPKDDDFDYLPKYGRLTVYNKMTGEPHIWEGIIRDLTDSTDEDETKGLNVELSSLDLLPNSANLKLVNGEWEVNPTAKVVVGQVGLNDIEIVVHVEIYD